MHAFLIIGKNPQKLASEIEKLTAKLDARLLPLTLQKIEDVRNLKKEIKYSLSLKTVYLAKDIDQATPEALNAFLKNLEEPNNNLYFILTSGSLDGILPTITSRCEVIKIKDDHLEKSFGEDVIKFENMAIDEKFKFIETIKDRSKAQGFLEDIILYKHQNGNFQNLENYLNALKNLKLNANVSLQLVNLLITS